MARQKQNRALNIPQWQAAQAIRQQVVEGNVSSTQLHQILVYLALVARASTFRNIQRRFDRDPDQDDVVAIPVLVVNKLMHK